MFPHDLFNLSRMAERWSELAQEANDDVATRVQEARDLLAEITADKNPSNKQLVTWVQQKDGIVGTGQHHRKRQVTRGQIMGDLSTFIGTFGS
jgi:hypothetical protein